jgi:hypothetical protein
MTVSKTEQRKKALEHKKLLALHRDMIATLEDIEGYRIRPKSPFNKAPEFIPEEPKTYKQYLEEDKAKDADYWNKKYNSPTLPKPSLI